MKKILVVTIGGSCAPIIKSIEQNTPDYVFFLCSDDDRSTNNKGSYKSVTGKGKVCGKDWKNPDKYNIVTQVGFEENQYEVHKIKYFDDHNECYQAALDVLKKIRKENPKADIIADYTGGTKSMTVGLVTAASDLGDITIAVVKGDRSNLIKVETDTGRVKLSRTNYAYLEKQRQNIGNLFKRLDYKAAQDFINDIFKSSYDLPHAFDDELQRLLTLAKGFDAWDKFQYSEALEYLSPMVKDYNKEVRFLKNIINAQEYLRGGKENLPKGTTGFEAVWDLLMNAERRKEQSRYDDAVARIYRATEMFGQVLIKTSYGLDTSGFKVSNLPDDIHEKYQSKSTEGICKIGLLDSFDLLVDLKDKNVIEVFVPTRAKAVGSLKIRNLSMLAHGFVPVAKIDFEEIHNALVEGVVQKIMIERLEFKPLISNLPKITV